MNGFENIKVEVQDSIGIIRINRPRYLNAVNKQTVTEIINALQNFENDDNIRVIIITGEGDNFSAGADIKEMSKLSPIEATEKSPLAVWDKMLAFVKKPIIAVVKGYAVGGGFEIALSCDIIIASEDAKFGQPEINIGLMPGAGGTQRLARIVGKYKAMEICLTGKFLSAKEAYELGIVNKVYPKEIVFEEAIKIAKEIAKKPPIAVRFIKDSINYALESNLKEGLDYERKLFYLLLSTEDAKEGMNAFIEKREPKFKGR